MKQWQYVVAGMLLITCNSNRLSAQDSLLHSIIHPDSLKQLVYTLAADSFLGRFTGTAECNRAASFIAGEFQKAGAVPLDGDNGYLRPFILKWRNDTPRIAYNVVAVIPGKSKSDEIIVFSAHYDHVGTRSNTLPIWLPDNGGPEKGDTVYNGANDNASGTSALISLARYFGHTGNNERSLVFIAFAGEELGLKGSQSLANTTQPDNVKAMINLEMLGRPVNKKQQNPYITGPYLSDLRNILNDQLYQAAPAEYKKQFFKTDPYRSEGLFARSDNYWFAMRGIPAHTIMLSSPRDTYYHSLNDEPATLNYPLMAKVIKAIAKSCTGLVEGFATPTRINPRDIR